jgi:hypothetical protein
MIVNGSDVFRKTRSEGSLKHLAVREIEILAGPDVCRKSTVLVHPVHHPKAPKTGVCGLFRVGPRSAGQCLCFRAHLQLWPWIDWWHLKSARNVTFGQMYHN